VPSRGLAFPPMTEDEANSWRGTIDPPEHSLPAGLANQNNVLHDHNQHLRAQVLGLSSFAGRTAIFLGVRNGRVFFSLFHSSCIAIRRLHMDQACDFSTTYKASTTIVSEVTCVVGRRPGHEAHGMSSFLEPFQVRLLADTITNAF
jgi:hypothetical protein